MPENIETPPRFEDEYPEEAAFLMRIFAAGGYFKQTRALVMLPNLPPVVGVARNIKCPCGSGRKAKVCHESWTKK